MPLTRSRGHARRREAWVAFAFLTPAIAGFLVFVLGPALAAIVLSLYDYDILTSPRFVGLANYGQFLRDARLPRIYLNTLTYVLWYVGATTILGVALAVAAHRPMLAGWRYLIRTAYFFPVLTSLASVSIVWQYLYNTDFGIINYYLGRVGIPRIPWLTSSQWAVPSLVVLGVWKNLGFNFVLFLAGLQSIPRHLYEAAALDGATPWQRFRYVTLPLLTPIIAVVMTFSVLFTFTDFQLIYVLTRGGPLNSTHLMATLSFQRAISGGSLGEGAALATAMVPFLLAAILFSYFGLQRRKWQQGGAND